MFKKIKQKYIKYRVKRNLIYDHKMDIRDGPYDIRIYSPRRSINSKYIYNGLNVYLDIIFDFNLNRIRFIHSVDDYDGRSIIACSPPEILNFNNTRISNIRLISDYIYYSFCFYKYTLYDRLCILDGDEISKIFKTSESFYNYVILMTHRSHIIKNKNKIFIDNKDKNYNIKIICDCT